jgi:hypothetical protein
MTTAKLRTSERYATQNEAAARAILADPDRYPGLPAIWARMYLSRVEAPPEDAEAGPLFRAAA